MGARDGLLMVINVPPFSHHRHACGHVDMGACPHQVLADTLTLSQPRGGGQIMPTLYWCPHQVLKATGRAYDTIVCCMQLKRSELKLCLLKNSGCNFLPVQILSKCTFVHCTTRLVANLAHSVVSKVV